MGLVNKKNSSASPVGAFHILKINAILCCSRLYNYVKWPNLRLFTAWIERDPVFSRLFILMINDLNPPSVSSWKYADDTTLAEVVPKGTTSTVQEAIAEVERWSKERNFI